MSIYRRPMAAILLAAALFFCTAFDNPDSLRLEVRASPDAALVTSSGTRTISPDKLRESAKRELPLVTPTLTDLYLASPSGTAYRLDASGFLWDKTLTERLPLTRSQTRKLLKKGKSLRKQHYGELTEWADARKVVPRKSTFAITDLETGLTFRVQNRAGSDHADVQPLTKEDTRIMAQIYSQGWSWRRKAILVTAGGHKLAASMNGMPHGGDGIPGNGFSGHFCVHFLNSSTHKSEHPDPIHQLMVHKAAGQLRSYLAAASPAQLAQSLIIALDHREDETVRLIAEGMDAKRFGKLAEHARRLSGIRLTGQSQADSAEPVAEPDVSRLLAYEAVRSVSATYSSGGSRGETLRLLFARPSAEAPWRLLEASPWTDE